MPPRERLQLSYELALFPPRLNAFWHSIRDGNTDDVSDDFLEALDDAARLHLALPEKGYASLRALERLALYQARSRAYCMPSFIRAVRARTSVARRLPKPSFPAISSATSRCPPSDVKQGRDSGLVVGSCSRRE